MFKFKDVEIAFDFRSLPQCDQEYLRTMSYETVQNRSVKHTGWSFTETYSDAGNYTLFNDKDAMHTYMGEFNNNYDHTASHLLNGKKFWFAWTYSKKNR